MVNEVNRCKTKMDERITVTAVGVNITTQKTPFFIGFARIPTWIEIKYKKLFNISTSSLGVCQFDKQVLPLRKDSA